MPVRARPRYVFLDGLRGVAALAIVIHHFSADSGRREIFASAGVAVDFFFCLSGFVIAHAYQDRLLAGMSLRQYCGRRLARLYPMYLVGWAMGLFALGLVRLEGLTDMTWESIAHAATLNAFYIPYFNHFVVQVYAMPIAGAIFPLNNPAWSLFYGMAANVLYAATLRHSRVSPVAWAAVSLAGLVVAGFAYGTAPGWGTGNFVGGAPRVLYAFFAGVALYQLRDRLAILPRPAWGIILAAVLVMFAVPRFDGYHYYWLACAAAVVPLLVAAGSRTAVARDSLLHRACAYSGRLSYPIFCVHYPLLMFFSVELPLDGRYVPVAVAFLAATIAGAHLLMRLVEIPVLRRLESGGAPT